MTVTTTARRTVPASEILARPDLKARPTRRERIALLRVMAGVLNTWMWEFHHVAGLLPAAMVDGRVPEQDVADYPVKGYPEELSQRIAVAAGISWHGDDGVDAEAVGSVIEALRSLTAGEADVHSGSWSIYEEDIDRHGLTLERMRELMRHYAPTLMDAAQLVVAANAVPIEDTH
jgi:hypothetical protein